MSVRYFSATLSGVTLFAIIGFAIIPAAIVGIILARESECSKFVISGGWILTTIVAGCSILFNPSTPTVGWVFLFFTAGLGHGLLLSSYNIRVHGLLQEEGGSYSTKPITVSIFMWSWGMAIAVPVGGVIFMNLFGEALFNAGLDRQLINTAHGYLFLMKEVNMGEETRDAVRDAASLGLQVVWEVITGMSAIGTISSAILWKR